MGLNMPKDQDKEWLAVDLTTSPYRNNIYMAWTEFDVLHSADPADSTRILFSRSTDHGLNWATPVKVSDVGGGSTRHTSQNHFPAAACAARFSAAAAIAARRSAASAAAALGSAVAEAAAEAEEAAGSPVFV